MHLHPNHTVVFSSFFSSIPISPCTGTPMIVGTIMETQASMTNSSSFPWKQPFSLQSFTSYSQLLFSCFRFILPSFHLSPKYDLSFCGILSQRAMHYGSRCCRMLDGTQRELIIIKLVGLGNTQRTPRVVSINIGFLHM